MKEEEFIVNAIINWLTSSTEFHKKHSNNEATVIAGIVLQKKMTNLDSIDNYRVLCVGTGTKCLGKRDLNTKGLVVNDCHAEIIARRAFHHYLYQELQLFNHNDGNNSSSIFVMDKKSGKLILKSSYHLHLFISESPCGDASIYRMKQEVVDQIVTNRVVNNATLGIIDTGIRSENRLTGAKRKREKEEEKNENIKNKQLNQSIGIARVKSGRSDLPQEKQTLSMSCSDKLAKWLVIGIQGTLLLEWYTNIYLSSIIVWADEMTYSIQSQEEAIYRALITRTNKLTTQNIPEPIIKVIPFDTERWSRHRKPGQKQLISSLSLNWIIKEPHWKIPSKKNNHYEVLLAIIGLKQGAKKGGSQNNKQLAKVSSRLSKWNFFQQYAHILYQLDIKSLGTYEEEKKRIRDTHVEYKQLVKNFLESPIGQQWVGVPSTFNQFSIP